MIASEERRLDPWVEAVVPHRARVLDLGCGSGELLERLIVSRDIQARGVEIDPEGVKACIGKGLAVYQSDIDEGLSDFEEGILDIVILHMTLSMLWRPDAVLSDMVRIGRQAVISFHNAGWLPRRWNFVQHGRIDALLPESYPWYRSPHVRPFSIADFETLCEPLGIRIVERTFVDRTFRQLDGLFARWPQDWAYAAVYLIERRDGPAGPAGA